MNLTELKERVHELEKTHTLLKETPLRLNFSSFALDELDEYMVFAVKIFWTTSNNRGIKRLFNKVFNLSSHINPFLVLEKDKKRAVKAVEEKLKTLLVRDEFYYDIFKEQYIRSTERLKSLTKGKIEEAVSAKTEKEVFGAYKEIFLSLLLYHFNLLSEEELYEKTLDSSLLVFKTTESEFYNNWKCYLYFEKVLSATPKEKTLKVKEKLALWYEENNISYLKKESLTFYEFTEYSFFLSAEKKKMALEDIKKKTTKRFLELEDAITKRGAFSAIYEAEILSFIELIKKIETFEQDNV